MRIELKNRMAIFRKRYKYLHLKTLFIENMNKIKEEFSTTCKSKIESVGLNVQADKIKFEALQQGLFMYTYNIHN